MKETILITGVSGVLGGKLLSKLIQTGEYNIIGLTSSPELVKANLQEGKSEVTLLDRRNWYQQIDKGVKITTFINCGFPRTSNPTELAEGIVDIIDLIKKSISINVKNIINISSQSVYSQKKDEAATEDIKVCPESLYGMTKYSVEKAIDLLCEYQQVNYSHLRLGSLVNLDFKNRMTYKFVEKGLKGEEIEVDGEDLEVSYLHVDDAVEGIMKMIKSSSKKWRRIYNLGSDEDRKS